MYEMLARIFLNSMSEMARRRTSPPVHVFILMVLAIAIAVALIPVTNIGDMNDDVDDGHGLSVWYMFSIVSYGY